MDDSCWFLRGKSDNLMLELLIDSGANPNILGYETYLRIPESQRPPLEPMRTTLMAANGDPISTYGQTCVNLILDGTTFSVPVIVANIGSMHGILGMRFMRDNDCMVGFRKGLMKCGNLIWQLIQPSQNGCFAVRLVSEVRIPPGHGILAESNVKIRTKRYDSGQGMLEADPQLLSAAGILVPRSLVQITGEPVPKLHVALSNLSEEEVILPPGMIVGRLSSADVLENKV